MTCLMILSSNIGNGTVLPDWCSAFFDDDYFQGIENRFILSSALDTLPVHVQGT